MKQSTIGTLKVLRDEEPKKLTSRIRLAWPEIKVWFATGRNNFDVASDGRLLVLSSQNRVQIGQGPIVVVLNWTAALNKK